MGKRKLIPLVLAIVAGTSMAYAAPQYDLGEVIVTATRLEENTQHVPASVNVVTAEEMKKRPVQNIADALAHTPGVYRSPVADGGTSSDLMMRGFGSSETLIMLDGQPLNSGWNGTVDWAVLPTTDIEKIEVVRGAGSSLYGGRAVGGVINIITAKSQEELSGNAVLSYGSDKTKRFGLHTKMRKDNWRMGVGYEKRSTDGYVGYYIDKRAKKQNPDKPVTPTHKVDLSQSARDYYIIGSRGEKLNDTETWSFSLGYDFDEDRSLDYAFTRSKHNYDYRNPFTYVYDKDGNPVWGGVWELPDKKILTIYPDDYLGYYGVRDMDVHRLQFADRKNQLFANFGYTNRFNDGYSSASTYPDVITQDTLNQWNGPGGFSYYPSKAYNFDIHKNIDIEDHTLTVGYNYNRESFAQTRFDMEHWRDIARDTGRSPYEYNGGRGILHAFYPQDKWQVADTTDLYLGMRYDRYKKEDGYNYTLQKNGTWKYNNFGSGTYGEWSPKVAVEHRFDENNSAFISYGHSFNPPILYQVYRRSSTTHPNPDLGPETTDTWEIGYKHADAKMNWDVTMFHAKTKDLISLMTPKGQPKAYYNSDEDLTRRGIEFGAQYRFNQNWSAYANYTLTDAKISGDRYYYIPRHLVHFGVQWDAKPWQVLLDNTYVSARQAPDVDTGEYQSEDSYFITSLSANYEIQEGLVLQGDIYNLFDKKFYAGEAARERTYTVSLQYRF